MSTIINKLPAGTELLVDCGAFTRWRAKEPPKTLGEYQAFIAQVKTELTGSSVAVRYFQLDVIGDAAATLTNYRDMLALGMTPIPIYTRGAPIADLDEMLDTAPIVALGGISRSSGERPHGYLSRLARAREMGRFHILGFSQLRWLPLYRPASVDSSSWLGAGRYGRANLYEPPFSMSIVGPGTKLTEAQRRYVKSTGASLTTFRNPEAWTGGLGVHNMVTVFTWLKLADVAHRSGTGLYFVATIPDELKKLVELHRCRDVGEAVRVTQEWRDERKALRNAQGMVEAALSP